VYVKRWDGMNWMSDGKERKGYKVESKNASADSQDEMTDGNKAKEDEYLVMFVWL
jgi:hypothetical protein